MLSETMRSMKLRGSSERKKGARLEAEELSLSSTLEQVYLREERRKESSSKKKAAVVGESSGDEDEGDEGEFVPREAALLEKQIRQRETEKLQRITYQASDTQFLDPEIEPLMSLVPLAYERMAKMGFNQSQQRRELKRTVNNVEELLEKISAIQAEVRSLHGK